MFLRSSSKILATGSLIRIKQRPRLYRETTGARLEKGGFVRCAGEEQENGKANRGSESPGLNSPVVYFLFQDCHGSEETEPSSALFAGALQELAV